MDIQAKYAHNKQYTSSIEVLVLDLLEELVQTTYLSITPELLLMIQKDDKIINIIIDHFILMFISESFDNPYLKNYLETGEYLELLHQQRKPFKNVLTYYLLLRMDPSYQDLLIQLEENPEDLYNFNNFIDSLDEAAK
jgi:hypothetical protein